MITSATHEPTMRAGLERFGYALLAGEIGWAWTERIRKDAADLFTPAADDRCRAGSARVVRDVHLLSREIDVLGNSDTVQAAARRVLATDHVVTVTCALLRIPAGEAERSPVQDACVDGFDFDGHVCAYVALDSLHARHGALMVYPRAHDRTRAHRGDPPGIDAGALPASRARHIHLHPGDVLFVHGWLPHGWTNNAGDRDLHVVRILYRGGKSQRALKPGAAPPPLDPLHRGDGPGSPVRTTRAVRS